MGARRSSSRRGSPPTPTSTLIAEQAPAIFLYSAHYDYAVSQRVRGVHLNHVIEPEDRFQYITDWYVNTTS